MLKLISRAFTGLVFAFAVVASIVGVALGIYAWGIDRTEAIKIGATALLLAVSAVNLWPLIRR